MSTTSSTTTTTTTPTMPLPRPPAPPLTLIVAATPTQGIGRAGQLPWRLKADLAFFARATTRAPPAPPSNSTAPPARALNALVMGRRTWESIPARLRPLRGRLNVVVSAATGGVPWVWREERGREGAGAFWAGSLDAAMEGLGAGTVRVGGGEEVAVGRVFVIGGSRVYEEALRRPEAKRVLLTRVFGEWECDTFFPVDLDAEKGWKRKGLQEFREWVGEDVPEGTVKEGDAEFEFRMYERD